MALYWLQIVDADGVPVLPPVRPVKGRHGSLELPLIEACEAAIIKQGVGVFRTEAHVRQAIRDGMAAAIQSLKDDYAPLVLARGPGRG